MNVEDLSERAERILKTSANIHQALKYIEAEANQVLTEIANANQLSLFEDGDIELYES
jgi:hypothetical protein